MASGTDVGLGDEHGAGFGERGAGTLGRRQSELGCDILTEATLTFDAESVAVRLLGGSGP
jgi:hypothetical protein